MINDVKIDVRIDSSTRNILEQYARFNSCSVSALCRRAIKQYVAREIIASDVESSDSATSKF